jgi:RNA polymerase sigma-70 factor, ECF subfamily
MASTDNSRPADDGILPRAIAAAQDGQRDALHFLYVYYADDVYRCVRSIVRGEQEAEDVTQDVFASLIGLLGSYERRSGPFHAWLLQLARHIALDYVQVARTTPRELRRLTA